MAIAMLARHFDSYKICNANLSGTPIFVMLLGVRIPIAHIA